VYSCFI